MVEKIGEKEAEDFAWKCNGKRKHTSQSYFEYQLTWSTLQNADSQWKWIFYAT